MAGFEQLLPFAILTMVTIWSLVTTLRNALPTIAGLRRELADCPATRELRYTIRAPRHVSRVNVITLPVTPRGPAPLHGPRAAA